MKSKAALAQAALSTALHSLDFLHIPWLGAGCLVWLVVGWICNTQSGVPLCAVHRVVFSWVHFCSMAVWKWVCSKQLIEIHRQMRVWCCMECPDPKQWKVVGAAQCCCCKRPLGQLCTDQVTCQSCWEAGSPYKGPAEEQGESQWHSLWQRDWCCLQQEKKP